MGIALGFALVQPAHISLLVFAMLGFGLALPYLMLSFVPALQKILPRPGAWMETFRQLLAFPMYASAAWLIWVLSQQSGPMGILAALMGLVLIALSIWLLRHMPTSKARRATIRILAVISFITALMIIPGNTPHIPTEHPTAQNFGESWTREKLEEALKGDKPVFVEMTAAWCITCKVNHAVAINTAATRKAFTDGGVRYLIGDWTNEDPAITEYLNNFGRNGVPIYVYYGPRDAAGTRPDPILLPAILAPGSVAKLITAD
jgi:thiol:disulfide interchange protein DsbD